jgi:post-segregation antitoxin (ccd killing protein)
MFVIRLPNGNLKVPQTAIGHGGRVIGDVYVEIGPQDADYSRLAAQALTPEEAERRRDRWQSEDEALRQEFLEFARRNGESSWPDAPDDGEEI